MTDQTVSPNERKAKDELDRIEQKAKDELVRIEQMIASLKARLRRSGRGFELSNLAIHVAT